MRKLFKHMFQRGVSFLTKVRTVMCGGREIRRFRLNECLKAAAARQLLPYAGTRETIAIVVPCFGHAAFLRQTAESVLLQTRKPDEVIFVNDASPDETYAILEEVVKANPYINIRVILNPDNKGQAFSVNAGVSESHSDLIMVLNDDDYLMHNAIEVAVNVMRDYKNIHLCGFSCVVLKNNSELQGHSKKSEISENSIIVKYPVDVVGYRKYNDINMTHSGCVFTKYAWQTVGGYLSARSERVVPFSDRDFQLRVNCCFPIGMFPDAPISFWRDWTSMDRGINS